MAFTAKHIAKMKKAAQAAAQSLKEESPDLLDQEWIDECARIGGFETPAEREVFDAELRKTWEGL